MNDKKDWLGVAAIFVIVFVGLALEISFTRLYSFLFESGYVYMIISLGISGLGIGSFFYYMRENLVKKYFEFMVPMLIFIFVSIFTAALLFPNIYFYMTASFIIFVAIGVIITAVYKNTTIHISVIYFVDLAGGGAGAVASYFLLESFGVVRTIQILFSVMLFAVWMAGSAYFFKNKKHSYLIFAAAILFTLNIFINLQDLIKIPADSPKEMANYINMGAAKIKNTVWNSFGRVDLVETTEESDKKVMFIDGGAGTVMLKYDKTVSYKEKIETVIKNNPELAITLLGLEIGKKKDALVIGSGGGIDVVTLKTLGIDKVTAVEINPSFIEMVKNYKEFNGNIYNDSTQGIDIIQGEGRNYVRNTGKKFDTLVISLPLIKSIRNFTNYAMTENYIFTENAFSEYRSVLKNDGYMVIVAHNSLEILRLIMNAVSTLKKEGIPEQEVMNYLAVVEISHHKPVLVLKKSPFIKAEAEILHEAFHIAKQVKREVSFIPFIDQETEEYISHNNRTEFRYMFNDSLYKFSRGKISFKDLSKQFSGYDISSITDDSPFFYNYQKGIPDELTIILIIGIAALVFIFAKKKEAENKKTIVKQYSKYFMLIGIAFIMVEIGFIQKFGFFWGQETKSVSIVLAAILVSTGIGSWISGFIKNSNLKILFAAFAVPIITVIYILTSDSFLRQFEGGDYLVKLAVTLLYIVPEFLIMGLVFPTLLENVKLESIDATAWMIAINSIAVLTGGTLAVIIAMKTGFSITLAIGGGLYLLLIGYKVFEKDKNIEEDYIKKENYVTIKV